MAIQTQDRLRVLQNYFTSTSGPTATSISGPTATAGLTIPAAKTTAGTISTTGPAAANTYSYGYHPTDPTQLTLLPKAAAALGVVGSVLVFGAAVVGIGLLAYALTKAALES